MSEFQRWWAQQPFITKHYISSAILLTLCSHFRLISPQFLTFIPSKIVYQLQIWRLFTPFLFLGITGNFLTFVLNTFFLFRYSYDLETKDFDGRKGDYLFMLLFGVVWLWGFGYWFRYLLLGQGLTYMLIYYWSRRNFNSTITFFFGFQLRAAYLPWVLVAMLFMFGDVPWIEINGILIGHLYFYLHDICPNVYRRTILKTPSFINRLFPAEMIRYQ